MTPDPSKEAPVDDLLAELLSLLADAGPDYDVQYDWRKRLAGAAQRLAALGDVRLVVVPDGTPEGVLRLDKSGVNWLRHKGGAWCNHSSDAEDCTVDPHDESWSLYRLVPVEGGTDGD